MKQRKIAILTLDEPGKQRAAEASVRIFSMA
jgi:hypothetical protein